MRHLLLLTLGPVQEFIAQARRTRDLWFGSHLLSEISRAAAADLAGREALLIFPSLEKDAEELVPSAAPLRPSGKPPLAIPNKILCEAPDGLDPAELASAAIRAAEARWLEFAAAVKRVCASLIAPGAERAWDEQLHTFLELGAAWTDVPNEDRYEEARRELEQEIAGRKLLRDFPAWHHQRGAVPKSSLDGARETVLAEPEQRPAHLVRRYRIMRGENLDAVGLIKRAGGEPEQFVPIVNVALAGWIASARDRFPQQIAKIEGVCEQEGFRGVGRPDLSCGRGLFAWDAEIFLKDRWAALLSEAAGEPKDTCSRQRISETAREWGRSSPMQELLGKMNFPFPYVACLVADGDHMGRALDHVLGIQQHRTFSARLSYFAERAREIVEQEHRGILVYAGGDDVLAFINVAETLSCAAALQAAFTEIVQEALASAGPDVPMPTLSVGIGIGHLFESMGHLRRLGGSAEKLAKTRRDALAMVVNKRSGGTTSLCDVWSDGPVVRLRSAVSFLGAGQLSAKKVHEIGAELSRMPAKGTLLVSEQAAWADLLRQEVERILARSGAGDNLTASEVGLSFRRDANYDARRAEVEQWVSRMLVAKVVAEATFAAQPKERS